MKVISYAYDRAMVRAVKCRDCLTVYEFTEKDAYVSVAWWGRAVWLGTICPLCHRSNRVRVPLGAAALNKETT